MNKIIVLLLMLSFSGFSQANKFTGTWSNENFKDSGKEYILNITVAESNYQIYGVAEVINADDKLNTGVLQITGYVDRLGNRAYISLKGNKISASAVLYTKDNILQFNKRGGTNLIPKETFLNKQFE